MQQTRGRRRTDADVAAVDLVDVPGNIAVPEFRADRSLRTGCTIGTSRTIGTGWTIGTGCTIGTLLTLWALRATDNAKGVRSRAQRDVGHHQFTADGELELIGAIERYRRHVFDATDLEAEQSAHDRYTGVRLTEHRVTAAQWQQAQVDVHRAVDLDTGGVFQDTLVIDLGRD